MAVNDFPIPRMRLVFQGSENTCGIACMAMITGVLYWEALKRLAPPPLSSEGLLAYDERERTFLNEKGWWQSTQLLLKTAIGIEKMGSCIEGEQRFLQTFENSQRVRLVLAFADGVKPDHTVVWDRDFKNIVFDPARGVIRLSKLLENVGPQSYSGTLGYTSYCYQPGRPMQCLVKREVGIEIPTSNIAVRP